MHRIGSLFCLLLAAACGSSGPIAPPAPEAPVSPPVPPTPAIAEAKPEFEIAHNVLLFPPELASRRTGDVSFDAAAHVTPASDATLLYVKSFLEAKEDITLLRAEVNIQATFGEKGDLEKSLARGATLKARMIELGIDPARLIVVGFGGSKPCADGTTPEGRAANDRVLFMVASMRGRLIGAFKPDGGGVEVE